jgi:hypothetical protein
MRRELILSNLRIELRRKQASYLSEKRAVKLVNDFLENMSIVHSSQIRAWQKDFFLSEMERNSDSTKDDCLQAKSALTFLFNIVLKKGRGIDVTGYDENDGDPGVLKITG